jgi:predicted PurR-regulated permease PerM
MMTLLFYMGVAGLCLGLVSLFHNLATFFGCCLLFTYLLLPAVDALEQVIRQFSSRSHRLPPVLTPPFRSKRFSLPKAFLGASIPQLTPRLMAVITLYTLLGLLLAGMVTFGMPLLMTQGADLWKSVPRYALQIRHMLLQWLPHIPALPFDEQTFPQWQTQLTQQVTQQGVKAGLAPHALSTLGAWSAHTLRGVIYGVSSISVVFYLLLDGPQRGHWLTQMLPPVWRAILRDCHAVLLRFVKGQVMLAIISGGLMLLLYTVFGVPHAVILSLIFTVAEIFPVIGPWFAFSPGIVVMLLGDNPWVTLYVLGIYFLLKDNIILPKVVGEVMGIHPVWIILAILVAAQLAGATGILFAVPLAALLGVGIKHWVGSYQQLRVNQDTK